jgi:3-deoxy-D-manno-octulosonate 8-phosphate phosphatase (KDO 8-P phosphatase)
MTRIAALATDVDGVLTDGSVWWGPEGEEWKRFSFRDIMGVSLARKAGLLIALISGEASSQVDQFARKMSIQDVYKGCRDKEAALREFAAAHGLDLAQVAFMGDDVNDVAALRVCGLGAAPADAHPAARAAAGFVASNTGGRGALRELVDMLLEAHADGGAPR